MQHELSGFLIPTLSVGPDSNHNQLKKSELLQAVIFRTVDQHPHCQAERPMPGQELGNKHSAKAAPLRL